MNQSALLTVFSSGAADPAPFDPASMFAGGLNGWLFNGAADQSDFLQSSGGSVAGDGDPLGYISDLSGNHNNVAQATGGSKPVCKVNGGIRSAYFTSNKSLSVTFGSVVPAQRTEVFVVRVAANTPVGEAYIHVMSGGSGWTMVFVRSTSTNVVDMISGGFFGGTVACPDYGNTFIFVGKLGVINDGEASTVYTYNAAGELVATASQLTNNDAAGATTMWLGYASPMIPFHVPFSMGIEGHPDTTDLVAYLADTFGAWSPT